jgi:spore maturation protein CgeB
MRFRLFYHSLVSDWNHGNAHFLRGIAAELQARGHDVRVFEPTGGWSRTQLERDHGSAAVLELGNLFPHLSSTLYDPSDPHVEALVDDADVVVVHEWTEPTVMDEIARHRVREGKYLLLFHDTHHRAVSDPDALSRMPIDRFDGVLAFGGSLARQYETLGWGRRVWVWHEAADTRVFYPRERDRLEGDLVWIGNWGDDERTRELEEFLLQPVERLQLRARVHGVRYPDAAIQRLRDAGIVYGGYVANYRVPEIFARYRVTVHVPRRPYVQMLRGIPTIRPFEALACGIPLVSAPWDDVEHLFGPEDYVRVTSGAEMERALERVLNDEPYARELATRGLDTIRSRHTCAHRVDELLRILQTLRPDPAGVAAAQEV